MADTEHLYGMPFTGSILVYVIDDDRQPPEGTAWKSRDIAAGRVELRPALPITRYHFKVFAPRHPIGDRVFDHRSDDAGARRPA